MRVRFAVLMVCLVTSQTRLLYSWFAPVRCGQQAVTAKARFAEH